MSVLLGVIDEPIGAHSTSMFTNKVGGEPDSDNIQEIRQVIKCSLCGHQLSQMAQIYCPLANSPYHRTLNIFSCVQRPCWNKSDSWKVLRRQALDQSLSSESKTKQSLSDQKDGWGFGEDDWGVEQDDWGDADDSAAMVTSQTDNNEVEDVGYESNDDSLSNEDVAGATAGSLSSSDELPTCPQMSGQASSDADLAATQMEQLLIDDEDGEMQQCVPEDIQPLPNAQVLQELLQSQNASAAVPTSGTVVFEPYFISVIDEPTSSQHNFRHEEKLLAKYKKQEGFDEEDITPPIKGSGGEEKYEKSAAKHGDVIFYKFMKKVELQPDQILRYEWNGKPLHINAKQQLPVPPCEQCGKPRIFELQLMPALIPQLRSVTTEGCSVASVEYGTAIIYVCQDSCWTDSKSFLEEFIHIEADPDQEYFKW